MNWTLLENSLLVAGMTTLLAVPLGVAAGLWAATLGVVSRRIFLALAILAAVLPPFLVTNAWLHGFGNAGVLQSWLPFKVYSIAGVVVLLTLLSWPFTTLATVGSLNRIEPALLEADPAMRGWPLIRWLLWPAVRNAVWQSAVIVLVLALNNFAIPAILQVKVFPAEMWVSFSAKFDHWEAFLAGLPLAVGPLLLLMVTRKAELAWPFQGGVASARAFSGRLGWPWRTGCGIVACGLLVLSTGYPLGELMFNSRTWSDLSGALAAGRVATVNSFIFAATSATVAVGAGLLLSRLKWMRGAWVFFVLPGIFIGLGASLLLTRTGLSALGVGGGMVIAVLALRYSGPAWSGISQGLESCDRDLDDAARLMGASWWQRMLAAKLPQAGPAIAAAWYGVYLLSLWDVETLVLILPPGGETLAVRVFNLLHYGHTPQVNALCVVLLGLAVLPIGLWAAGRWLVAGRSAGILGSAAVAMTMTLSLTGCAPGDLENQQLESRLFGEVRVIGSRGTGPGQFNKPRSVAVDADDNLYVVDMTGRVQKFSASGQYLLSWQMPQTDKGKPKGMGLDSEGRVILVEPHYSRVNHFLADGRLAQQWGIHGTNFGELSFPRAVAVSSTGLLYVSEYGVTERVHYFTKDGKSCIGSFGRPGLSDGEFNRPEGLCLDRSDNVLVADSCNHRIQVFDSQGKHLRTWGRAGKEPGELSYPYDIRVDKAGRRYICEFGNSRIQIVDDHFQVIEILGGVGPRAGQMSNPWSIALDSRGNLYVADAGNHRVQKFVARTKSETASTRSPRGDVQIGRSSKSS